MDETDHGLTPRIADLKVNRKVNEINDLPTPVGGYEEARVFGAE